MTPEVPGRDLLDALNEPAFVLSAGGRIEIANRAARRLLGGDPEGTALAAHLAEGAGDIGAFLDRSAGSTAPSIGATVLRGRDGEGRRVRLYGARLPDRDEAPPRLALRCMPASGSEFSVLARKVRELNAEIVERQAVQARLETSLEANETLLRELHHRVKNNLQVMMSLFRTARRETDSPEVRAFIDTSMGRLTAIGAAQRLVTDIESLSAVRAERFLGTVCDSLVAVFAGRLEVEARADPGTLGSAQAAPLALILNELLTNAMKHGAREGRARATVALERGEDAAWTLRVRDDGPGMPPEPGVRRGSGLGLVRGLARQIGGTLAFGTGPGACLAIRFREGAPQ